MTTRQGWIFLAAVLAAYWLLSCYSSRQAAQEARAQEMARSLYETQKMVFGMGAKLNGIPKQRPALLPDVRP